MVLSLLSKNRYAAFVLALLWHACGIFAPGGGYVFNAIHNIQQTTPTENILAMFDAVKIYNQEISHNFKSRSNL